MDEGNKNYFLELVWVATVYLSSSGYTAQTYFVKSLDKNILIIFSQKYSITVYYIQKYQLHNNWEIPNHYRKVFYYIS